MSDTETDTSTHQPPVTQPSPVQQPGTNGHPPAEDAPPQQAQPIAPGATFRDKFLLAAYLLLWVIVLLPSIWKMIDWLNASAMAEVSVNWEMPTGVTLNPGPAAFRYDVTQKKLVHYGVITAERKLELRALFVPAPQEAANTKPSDGATRSASEATPPGTTGQIASGPSTQTTTAGETGPAAVARVETLRKSYSEAIDNLAYLTTARQGAVISFLLILGGFGGALGAILRSLVDFVGNASYKDTLDLGRWWPLYFTRPLVGAILGFTLVVLFKAQLLTGGNPQPGSDTFWWLGVAVLGGFSTVDVTLRLRMAAKALFGESSKKEGDS
jgi:hypothetical protein